jgi:hypothetical protein
MTSHFGVLALTFALTLAGCGTDVSKTENAGIARTTFKGIAALLPKFGKDSDAAAQPVDQEAIALSALQLNAGPVLLVGLEATGGTTAAGMVGENGSMRTYNTPQKQSLILRDGLIVGTRGFGNDVMSANVGAVAALIHARRAGTAPRTPYYLDGEGVERPLPLSCTVSLGETKSYSFAGTDWETMQVAERCTAPNVDITNSYLVTPAGQIALSRQWLAPGLGFVTLQTLRP